MKKIFSIFLAGLTLMFISPLNMEAHQVNNDEKKSGVVQLALLLDTSNSMDGLIAQAKSELWFIVNEVTKLQRNGVTPRIEVSLYEYGKSSIPANEQHLRQITALSSDLEKLSEELFTLSTNGGDEYCGAVIRAAENGLKWSTNKNDIRMVFVAGNESFAQGQIDHKSTCRRMTTKDIVVNTIYCGNRKQGIDLSWNDGAAYGDGDFFNINENSQAIYIACPQDSDIEKLGSMLNNTYVPYGKQGQTYQHIQLQNDINYKNLSQGSSVQRQLAKGGSNYRNSQWDLVDAVKEGTKIEDLKKDMLNDKMKQMSLQERKDYIASQQQQREKIKKKMALLIKNREAYLDKVKKDKGSEDKNTLKYALSNSIRKIAEKKGFSLADHKHPN